MKWGIYSGYRDSVSDIDKHVKAGLDRVCCDDGEFLDSTNLSIEERTSENVRVEPRREITAKVDISEPLCLESLVMK